MSFTTAYSRTQIIISFHHKVVNKEQTCKAICFIPVCIKQIFY